MRHPTELRWISREIESEPSRAKYFSRNVVSIRGSVARIVKPKLSILLGMLVAMLVVLYVLSIGPVYRAIMLPALREGEEKTGSRHTFVGGPVFSQAEAKWLPVSKVYTPLFWIADRSPAFHDVLNWYIVLWE